MTDVTLLSRRTALAKLALIGTIALAGAAPAFADDDGGHDNGGGNDGNDDNGNDNDNNDDNGNDGDGNNAGGNDDNGNNDSGEDKPKNLMELLSGKHHHKKK
jgi:hypothetical protein